MTRGEKVAEKWWKATLDDEDDFITDASILNLIQQVAGRTRQRCFGLTRNSVCLEKAARWEEEDD